MFAFMFFVVFDLSTTFVGMDYPSLYETNPYFKIAYANDKYIILAAFKFGIFAFMYFLDSVQIMVMSKIFDKVRFPLIPFVLMIVGMDVTIHNFDLLLKAGAGISELVFATLAIVLPAYIAKKIYDIHFDNEVM